MIKNIVAFSFGCICLASPIMGQHTLVVSTSGSDQASGTASRPLKTINAALNKAKISPEREIKIILKGGTYYLSEPIKIQSRDFIGKKLEISASSDEQVTVSGALPISPVWTKTKKGYWQALVDLPSFDQLVVNGEKQILARYPNYKENVIYNGTAEDALSPKRIKGWKNPKGGFIHSLHGGEWGGMHYRITEKDGEALKYEGGHQNNRPSGMHNRHRFVENIFEELDAPLEWFYDNEKKILFYYPSEGLNPNKAKIEVAILPDLIQMRGTVKTPLMNVSINNICFEGTTRTFMEPYERLMRSDWCVYRGAAVFLENTDNCSINDCEFTRLGGNAVFISKYNRLASVSGSYFHHIGASAICLVGDTSAVRSGSMQYGEFVPFEKLDFTPGAANVNYPRECTIDNNLIHHIGQVEKQVAGVEIQIAAHINVTHNTIYQVPRAAINIGDGAFGGHIIAYNDAFETVLETSDHGAFNSWGRDRFWHPYYEKIIEHTDAHPELILLDARYTTVLRNNRFRCDHGWDIDLDDGSSNYHIYNNLCLKGGIKLREGFFRKVENNILLNNSLHPHVWFAKSGDIVERNIFMRPYYPIELMGWGKYIDYNYFPSKTELKAAQKNNTDKHSKNGELEFVDAPKGDFTVLEGNDAFLVGFENFPMDCFGVYSPKLIQKASKPEIPDLLVASTTNAEKEYNWIGAQIRYVKGLGERSAYGLPDENGIIILELEPQGVLANSGLRKGDVVRTAGGLFLSSVGDLFAKTDENRWTGTLSVEVFRNQKLLPLTIKF